MTRSALRRLLTWLLLGLAIVAIVVVLWNQGGRLIRGEAAGIESYLLVLALIFGDAICPVLPGETTLNAAALLAAHDRLSITLIIVAGAVGAVLGDSVVFWIARTAKGRVRGWLDPAAQGNQMRKVVHLLARRGTIFLLFGRYIPGIRFALNVTLGGIVKMPYLRFLFWSSISGTIWSTVTCLSAFYIGTALEDYPLASFIITTVAMTTVIAVLIRLQTGWSDRRRAAADQPTA